MDPVVVAAVKDRLNAVRADHGVAIPLAVESGSRAWGFPSPDSDYDCRFVYVRRMDDYLTPWPRRDVIETPLEGVFDVVGWDLTKALQLLVKGNAAIVEWLMSPITYAGDPLFRTEFIDLARVIAPRGRIVRHYLHLGRQQFRQHVTAHEEISLKRLFYVLRPAMALRWMRLNPEISLPPMDFRVLVAGADLPPAVVALVADLLERKARTREMGVGTVRPEVLALVEREFNPGNEDEGGGTDEEHHAVAAAFFRRWVRRLDGAV
ncbi:MAG: nucleotidyltransferase domain-containing protein [Zavarzinia sp.]|nr:nucleotidyltransferase domain-containing protein [Zavarzinia sp.]